MTRAHVRASACVAATSIPASDPSIAGGIASMSAGLKERETKYDPR